jgi:hypothetical protein
MSAGSPNLISPQHHGVPVGHRMVLPLSPDPDTPALARDLVGDACRVWRLPEVFYPGRLVMSELVTNAVEHARARISVVVTHRAGGLLVAVEDDCPALPRLIGLTPPRRGHPLNERGQGLRTVQATATRWGALPLVNGKLVWALIRRPI